MELACSPQGLSLRGSPRPASAAFGAPGTRGALSQATRAGTPIRILLPTRLLLEHTPSPPPQGKRQGAPPGTPAAGVSTI